MTLVLKSPKLLNRAFSRNPIYLIKKYQECYYCHGVKVGRVKFYSSLWELHSHMAWQHKTQPRWKDIILHLADKIIEEELK